MIAISLMAAQPRPKKAPAKKAAAKKASTKPRMKVAEPEVVSAAQWPPVWMKTLFVMTLFAAWVFTFIGRYTITGFKPPAFIDGAFLTGFTFMLGIEGLKRVRGNGS